MQTILGLLFLAMIFMLFRFIKIILFNDGYPIKEIFIYGFLLAYLFVGTIGTFGYILPSVGIYSKDQNKEQIIYSYSDSEIY